MTSIKELFADYPETRQAIKLITEGTKEDILIGIELLKKDHLDLLKNFVLSHNFIWHNNPVFKKQFNKLTFIKITEDFILVLGSVAFWRGNL